jgi:hypothetical protein
MILHGTEGMGESIKHVMRFQLGLLWPIAICSSHERVASYVGSTPQILLKSSVKPNTAEHGSGK